MRDEQNTPVARLSYKFQRLRERLRTAIGSGELSGKLPGERQLARQFRVNAKTLSKALTDLAAEGLLERRIGRGTYVRPAGVENPIVDRVLAAPGASPVASQRWLILCADAYRWQPVLDRLNASVVCETHTRLLDARPSAVNGFTACIDFCPDTPQQLTRDLIVRGVPVVKVDQLPQTYSTSAVLVDRTLAVNNLVRQLLLRGHRRIFVVEKPGATEILPIVQETAGRLDPSASVDPGGPEDAVAAVRHAGATAVVCCCAHLGRHVVQRFDAAGILVPTDVSLAAVGVTDDPPCTGVYVRPDHMVETITRLARPSLPRRPTVLWLNGEFHDGRTCDGPRGASAAPMQSLMGSGDAAMS
jgi:hypothetical protein